MQAESREANEAADKELGPKTRRVVTQEDFLQALKAVRSSINRASTIEIPPGKPMTYTLNATATKHCLCCSLSMVCGILEPVREAQSPSLKKNLL